MINFTYEGEAVGNLERFPQYKDTFKVYFCKSDDGARFV